MAKSTSGKTGKEVKIITVDKYKKKDGTLVPAHKRSTPNK